MNPLINFFLGITRTKELGSERIKRLKEMCGSTLFDLNQRDNFNFLCRNMMAKSWKAGWKRIDWRMSIVGGGEHAHRIFSVGVVRRVVDRRVV